jgi:hypothetical protein
MHGEARRTVISETEGLVTRDGQVSRSVAVPVFDRGEADVSRRVHLADHRMPDCGWLHRPGSRLASPCLGFGLRRVTHSVSGDQHTTVGDLDQTIICDHHINGLAGQPTSHVIGEGGQTDPTTLAHPTSHTTLGHDIGLRG